MINKVIYIYLLYLSYWKSFILFDQIHYLINVKDSILKMLAFKKKQNKRNDHSSPSDVQKNLFLQFITRKHNTR